MASSTTWSLLQQEGLLAQACLCNGLTGLRHGNIGENKGLFYSAFFELSIGFERVMKLVLIIDHMARNNLAPPPYDAIRKYQHDLMRLFGEMKTVCTKRNLTSLDAFTDDSLAVQILRFLHNFADPAGRYANISKLTRASKASVDPLTEWAALATTIIQESAMNRERQRISDAGTLAKAVSGVPLLSLMADLDQQPLEVAEILARAPELEIAARHAIFELIRLIAALRDVLEAVTVSAWAASAASAGGAATVPDMKEFLEFAWPDKKYVMRKKRWP